MRSNKPMLGFEMRSNSICLIAGTTLRLFAAYTSELQENQQAATGRIATVTQKQDSSVPRRRFSSIHLGEIAN
jgi:hypothetical protein